MTKSYNYLRLTLLWVTIFGLHYCLTAQNVLTLTPIQDNTLYETTDGSLSNGSGSYLFAGKTGVETLRRALLQFDVSELPENAVVQGVRLEMNVSKSAGMTTEVTLHRTLQSWGEGASDAAGPEGMGIAAMEEDATWLHRYFSDELWTIAGGDFESTASASTTVSDLGQVTWESEKMTSDVQTWLTDATQNFGWMLRGEEVMPTSAHRFDARESENPPTLYIVYMEGDDDGGDDDDGDDDGGDDDGGDDDGGDDDGGDDDGGDDDGGDDDGGDDDGGDDDDGDDDDGDDDDGDDDDGDDDDDDDNNGNDENEVDANKAFLQIIHNVPDPLVNKVNISINGRPFTDNLTFRDATAFIEVPADMDVVIEVAPVLGFYDRRMNVQQRIRFDGGNRYTMMVSGVIRTQQFDRRMNGNAIKINVFSLAPTRIVSEEGDGFVDLIAFHGSTDAPALDVLMPQINDQPVDDLSYANFTEYVSVPAFSGRVQMDVMDNTQTQMLGSFFGDLSLYNGQALTIFSSGFLDPRNNQNGASFGIFAVQPNGKVFELEKGNPENRSQVSVTVKRIVKLSPNPAESWVNIDLEGWETTVPLQIQLFSNDGKLVREETFIVQSDTESVRWNLVDLPKQMYLLRCQQGERSITQPLSINR